MTETIERPHGSRDKYTYERCRCTPCREAFSAYRANREEAIAAGTWKPFVPAWPVRARVRRLMAAGMGRRAIAEQARVPESTLSSLLYGHPGTGRRPSRRINPETAERLLSVRAPRRRSGPPAGMVDGTGTRRRLQALATRGWPSPQIASRVGISAAHLNRVRRSGHVSQVVAERVSVVYDELWDQAPPSGTRAERIAVAKVRAHARRSGWVSPLAWNDDEIDNPAAKPHGIRPVGLAA